MLRQLPFVLFGLVLTCGGAQAASCGTFAAPLACGLAVGGQVQYSATNFFVQSASGSTVYQAGDIAIDISAGGGNSLIMSFSKLSAGPTPGIVFFANAGQTANFVIRYDLSIAPVLPGTVDFLSPPVDVAFVGSSALANGLATTQLILSDGMVGVSCVAVRNSIGVTSGNCALPPNAGTTLQAGDFVSLSGNTGNASIGTIQNYFDASFTAAVPEPASWALFGAGALMLGWRVRRHLGTTARY